MSSPQEIDISGLDEAAVLAALHNGSRAQGMGVLHDLHREMTVEEARAELAEWPDVRDGKYRFDYFHGRVLKVSFGNGKLRGAPLYDRDLGDGACERVIAQLRAQVTT